MEAYTEAYQLTSKPEYKKLVQHLIQFIKQDMMNPGGSFYSAIDADSEGKKDNITSGQKMRSSPN